MTIISLFSTDDRVSSMNKDRAYLKQRKYLYLFIDSSRLPTQTEHFKRRVYTYQSGKCDCELHALRNKMPEAPFLPKNWHF